MKLSVSFPNRDPARHLLPVTHDATARANPTVADLLGVVLASKATGGKFAGAGEALKLANDQYFDAVVGAYMVSPAELPPGIATRVPAAGDTPSAEVLALLAGVDAKTADLIRRNLVHQIEYDELPPGDILLGLSQTQK